MNSASTSHSAAGQYLGFALQPVRLCYHLLTCPDGAYVSLEHLDDVAIHLSDGAVVMEQTKSALAHNPLSTMSVDLWKTIANWLNSATKGEIELAKTQFRLYVTPVKTGPVAMALDAAETVDEVAAIVSTMKKAVAKKEELPVCMPHLQVFLNASPADRVALVSRLKIVSIHTDPVNALRALVQTTVQPNLVDLICHAAIGMAKEQADHCIRHGQKATIDADAFRKEFQAFVQRNNLPGYLAPFSKIPAVDVLNELLTTRPVFVRQLDLIEASSDQRLRAVSDFLRASADKSVWAEAGLVFEGSFDDWDEDLLRHHSAVSGEIADIHGDKSDEVRGRLAYRRCSVLLPPLDGRVVPSHFVHGSFNALADEKRLGWHPQFETLLASEP